MNNINWQLVILTMIICITIGQIVGIISETIKYKITIKYQDKGVFNEKEFRNKK